MIRRHRRSELRKDGPPKLRKQRYAAHGNRRKTPSTSPKWKAYAAAVVPLFLFLLVHLSPSTISLTPFDAMHLLSRSLLPLSILLTRISALALDKSNGTFDLNTCLSNIEAVYPSDADWAKDSEPFNLRLDDAFEPIAIVYPASEWHVSTAVKCAAQFNVSVSARSGGHVGPQPFSQT